jgi:hypothetical protein
MVWCGMVWCGMVWYGMVCYGTLLLYGKVMVCYHLALGERLERASHITVELGL